MVVGVGVIGVGVIGVGVVGMVLIGMFGVVVLIFCVVVGFGLGILLFFDVIYWVNWVGFIVLIVIGMKL